jgi:hypothetical protein
MMRLFQKGKDPASFLSREEVNEEVPPPSAVVPLSNSNNTLWRTESFLARLGALLNLKRPDLFDGHKMISSRAPHFLPWKRSLFRTGKNNHKTWMPRVGRTGGGKTNLAPEGMYNFGLQHNPVDMSDSHSCDFVLLLLCQRSPLFLVHRNQPWNQQ